MNGHNEYAEVITRLRELGGRFAPAARESMWVLEGLRIPANILAFYARYEPLSGCEVNGVRLYDAGGIVGENFQAAPGIVVHRFGYVVFASNEYGDGYCFDLKSPDEPHVVLFNHEMEFVSRENAELSAEHVAASFLAFLNNL